MSCSRCTCGSTNCELPRALGCSVLDVVPRPCLHATPRHLQHARALALALALLGCSFKLVRHARRQSRRQQGGTAAVPAHAMVEWLAVTACETSEHQGTAMLGMGCRCPDRARRGSAQRPPAGHREQPPPTTCPSGGEPAALAADAGDAPPSQVCVADTRVRDRLPRPAACGSASRPSRHPVHSRSCARACVHAPRVLDAPWHFDCLYRM
jgi:hypothetical protein